MGMILPDERVQVAGEGPTTDNCPPASQIRALPADGIYPASQE